MSAKGQDGYAVLIVDDSHDDLFLIRRCLGRLSRASIVAELHDGDEAICYLSGEEPFSDRKKFPVPDVVILDLKMPKCGGFEVLQWLKAHPIAGLTVAVLSGSDVQKDLDHSLSSGAHGFWTKAPTLDEQTNILLEIETLLDKRRWGNDSTATC